MFLVLTSQLQRLGRRSYALFPLNGFERASFHSREQGT
jgi:hypothetical protein